MSADTEGELLRAWTVHSYDLSRTAGAAVSTRCVAADELEILSPEPVNWLKEMEYVPSCIVMRSKKYPEVKLEIDLDLLRSLIMIDHGYPASLLSSQYEQIITQFVQALCSANVAKDYSDGCMLGPGGNATKYKRLLINRFLLETIVLSVVDSEDLLDGIDLRSLGDALRNSYKIIIGTDSDVDYEILDEFGIAAGTPEDLRGELSDNAKAIANMLISMGLAKRYADGVTIIGRGL